jgi:uncharacterized membrane protein
MRKLSVARVLPYVAVALTAGLGILLTAPACGGEVDCTTVKKYSELSVAFEKCTSCHSSTLTNLTSRNAAPLGTDYDTYDLAKTQAADIVEQLENGEMPPADEPALTDQEYDDLLTWASCGTPN